MQKIRKNNINNDMIRNNNAINNKKRTSKHVTDLVAKAIQKKINYDINLYLHAMDPGKKIVRLNFNKIPTTILTDMLGTIKSTHINNIGAFVIINKIPMHVLEKMLYSSIRDIDRNTVTLETVEKIHNTITSIEKKDFII